MAQRRSRTSTPKVEYPVCVRHLKPRKDVRLRYYFMCDACAEKWTTEAFDGNASLWDGMDVQGYCHLCNEEKPVRLRTWFLCDICWRVAGSIGRNHVAERAILDWWRRHIQPNKPQLVIEQNDVSALRPRRDADVSGEGPLDFLIRDSRSGKVILGIENKTGRSSIREMSAFQLDVSDCDSILHHVRALDIPCYLVHAQVLERWKPPTVGFTTIGLWWTDIYRMAAAFRDVRMRRDEQRGAAYYRTTAFQDMDTLAEALFDASGDLALVEQYRREGVPCLYKID